MQALMKSSYISNRVVQEQLIDCDLLFKNTDITTKNNKFFPNKFLDESRTFSALTTVTII